MSLRWYQNAQDYPLQPSLTDDRTAGWYAGGIVEYGSFDLPLKEGTSPDDEDEFLSNGGSFWFVLAESGHRLPVGRSGFLDVRLQAGARLGEGYERKRYQVLSVGTTETHTSTSVGAGT